MRLPAVLLLLAVLCSTVSAQSNDSFEDRLTLSGIHPTAVSNNLRATRQTGEPNHASASAGRSLWWTWTATTTGTVNIGTYSTGTNAPFLRAVGVYTGDALGALTEVASSNNSAQAQYVQYSAYQVVTGASINVPVTTGSVYQIAVDALTSARAGDDGTVVLAINPVPTILSAANTTATVGASFTHVITATGGPTAFAATDLPVGLAVNTTTGQITGTPATAGTYSIGLSATGPGGTGTAILTLRVNDPAPSTPIIPVITSAASTRGLIGTAFSFSLSATGSPTAYSATNLPAGLSFTPQTGLISGTPTVAGTTSVPVSATGAGGTGTATLTLLVDAGPPPPIITSALSASGTTGSAFSYAIYTNVDSQTGAAPTGFTATNLPPGLILTSGSSNYLSGTPTQPGTYAVPISVTNAGGTRSAIVTITISDPVAATPTAAAPILNSNAAAAGIVGATFSYQFTAANTPTAYTVSSLPPGLSFDPQKGLFSGTPTSAGTFLVPVSATNNYGISAGTLTITVAASTAAQTAANGITMPIVSSPAAAAGYVGQSLTYGIAAAYPGYYYSGPTGTWTFSATGLPPGLNVTLPSNSSSGYGIISGTPTTAGLYQATITVTGPSSGGYPASTGTAVVTFLINTGGTLAAPVITGSATASITVGASISYSPSASNSPTSYAASGLPAGLSISATSGTVSGMPTAAGTYAATISATNAAGTGTATVTFIVATQTTAPLITSAATAAGTVGNAFSYSIYTGSTITSYGASSLPPGLSLNASTGVISGTPTQAGVYAVPVSAANAAGTANATLTLTISATAAICPPTITSDAVSQATVGQSFYYYIYTDVGATSYAVGGNLPPWLSLSAGSNYLSGTPTTPGTYTVPISATNAAGTGTATLTIIVTNPDLPVFSSACALAATVGQSFSSWVSASNSPTSYTFSGLPPGITQSSSSPGYLTGTPTQAGVYTVPVSAVNVSGTASATLTITVSPAVVSPPVVSSALGTTAVAGTPFQYTVQASNLPTSYTANTLPAGLQFTPSTGVISGTPTNAGTYTLNFSATNSAGTGTAVVNLVVYATSPDVPVITAQAGAIAYYSEPFYLAVSATNAPTNFTATNLPAGLSIDATTGVISGTPTSSSGTFSAVITATNAIGSSRASIDIAMQSGRSAPHFTSAATTSAVVNQAFSRTLSCNAAVSSYSVTGLPAGLTYSASTGLISGTPTVTGSWTVALSASTSYGAATGKMQIVIGSSAGTRSEVISAAGVGGSLGLPLAYPIKASNSPTGYAASGLPAGLTLNSATGVISGTPTATGTTSATITVTNSVGSTVAPLAFNVMTTTLAEVTSAAGIAGYTGNFLSYTVTVGASSSGWTVYSSSLPYGLSYNSTDHTISGTPTSVGSQVGYLYVYNASGSQVATAHLTFNIAVSSVGAPVLSSAASAASSVGGSFTYVVGVSNAASAYTASNLPAGLSFNSTAHLISGTPTAAGTYAISLSASNASGTGTGTLTLAVAGQSALALTSTSNALERIFTVGTASSSDSIWYLYATNSPTTYAASGLPPGLSLNTATGRITGMLNTVGTYPVTVSATNSVGTASAIITYVVSAATLAPAVMPYLAAGYSGFVGAPLSTVYLSATNSPTSYAASGLPPGFVFNTLTGQISGTPTTAGTYTVNLSATNAAGIGTAVWQVVINDDSVLYPVFSNTSAQFSVTVGQNTYFEFYAYTYSGGSRAYTNTTITVAGLPSGVQVYSSSANYLELSCNPVTASAYPLTFTATALGGATATMTGTLVVVPAPAPTITSAAGALGNVNNAFSYSLSAGNTVTTYSAGTLPAGLTLNASTGQITGTPTSAGTSMVPVSATGPYGTASAVVTIRIDPPLFGGLPIITSAAAASSQDIPNPISSSVSAAPLSYTIKAINGPVTFAVQNLPAGLSFNVYTGVISGIPTATGVLRVPITATNAVGTASATLTILSNSPLPALLTGLVYPAYVGKSCSDAPSAYFPATSLNYGYLPYYFYGYSATYDPLVYAAVGLPSGLTINRDSGVITGTSTQAGTYPVALSVANRAGATQIIRTFFVAETAPAATPVALPTFSGRAEAAGFVGVPMIYSLSATGATSYAAVGLPAAFVLDPATGVIRGTPTSEGTTPVTVYATNAGGTRQATLLLTVESAPTTPTIYTAAAATASISVPFSYLLATTNYNNMPLPTAYAASGLPAGLSINVTSGTISGTPTGPAGTYTVPISVATGSALTTSVSLTFRIQPAPAVLPAPVLSSAAGASGLVGNPFSYAIQNAAFTPSAALPSGLTYDSATGTINGYPTAAGTYLIPFSAPDPNGSDPSDTAVRVRERKTGVATPRPARHINRPVLSPVLAADSGSAGLSATLTLRVSVPDISLPRLTAQPVGGAAFENAAFTFSSAAVGVPAPVYQWKHNGMLLPGVNGSTLTLDPVQSGDTGEYTLTATNAAGSVTSNVAALVVQTNYGNWQADHFTPQEIASGLAADAYSFSGDGVSNLLKYALGLEPRSKAVAALPTASRAADGALEIQFNRDAGKTDIDYLVEVSADLRTWTAIAQSVAGAQMVSLGGGSVIETALPGSTQRTVTVEAAAPTTGQAQFLHIRIIRR